MHIRKPTLATAPAAAPATDANHAASRKEFTMSHEVLRSGRHKMCALLLAGLTLICGTAFARDAGKLARDLPQSPNAGKIDVIIQFNQMPTSAHHAKVHGKGGELTRDLSNAIKGAAYSVPAARLKELSADPDVKYISPNRKLNASLDAASPALGMDLARSYGWTGQGIGIAVIDSGVASHPDL